MTSCKNDFLCTLCVWVREWSLGVFEWTVIQFFSFLGELGPKFVGFALVLLLNSIRPLSFYYQDPSGFFWGFCYVNFAGRTKFNKLRFIGNY